YIIADKAAPIECMSYNGKVKKGYFAYFQARNRNGVLTNYPCYCVIPDQLGVNHLGNSNAELTGTVASPRIYGAIMSGYPYNRPADLGLETNKEAYYATRNVVWTLAGNWDYSLWESDGTEVGERVKAAMDQIYAKAQKWMAIPVELECKLTQNSAPKEAGEYVEAIYTITANYDATHTVSVFLKDAPASAVITDTSNQEKSEFAVGDDFKVRVPKKEASNADFDVQLYVQAKDNAVYYAKTAQANMQDYYATFDPINTSFSNAKFTYGAVSAEPDEPDMPDTPVIPDNPVQEDGSVTVYKKDKSGRLLAGAVFKVLKDGAEIGSFGTDSNGRFSFPVDTNTLVKAEVSDPHDGTLIEEYEPLENGTIYNTYSIIEVEAPYGYLLSEDNNQTITTIADGNGGLQQDSFTVTFVNEPYGNLLIEKTDKDTNRYLSGAVFRVTYLASANDDYSFTSDVTTDGTGMASLTKLKPGSYSIEEIKAPAGYLLDSKKEIVTVSSGETAVYHGVNSHKPGISIYKYDPNNDIPLAGAVFKIEGIDNPFSGEYKTDLGGMITVEDLPAGSYRVTELQAPAGYVVSGEKSQTVELSPGQLSAQLVFENLEEAKLQIKKLDEDTNETVAGAEFQIRGIDNAYHGDFVTDENGEIHVQGLVPGSYEITETTAAPGYALNTENRESVELKAGETTALVFYNQKLAVLEILKVDKVNHAPLKGVTYNIKEKGGTDVGDYTTDKDGRIYLDTLEEGWYTVTEKAVPEGVILDDTPKDIYVKKGEIVSVTYENSMKPRLVIEKLDSVTKDVLSGAKFKVWYAENESDKGNLQLIGTFTTGDGGQIDLGRVDTGWYRIQEVQAPSGYELSNPDTKEVFMKADEDQTITFEDIPKSAIVIKKVDADNGKPLEGAYFRLRYLGGTSGTGGTTIGEYATTNNGTIVVTGLKAGTYIVEEISAPNGYVINDAAKTVYLSGLDQDVITVTFGNDKLGKLMIVKKDKTTLEPLSGVAFEVKTSDGTYLGTSNGKYVTDSAGTILIEDLEPGITVVVKETRAKDGYVLDDTPQSVKVKASETVTLEFLNQVKSSLLIVKKDAVTDEPLADVEFLVTDSSGGVIGNADGKYVTDSAGTIRIDNLPPGMTAVVKETKALPGYVLDDTPQSVKIKANETMVLEFLNEPKGGLIIVKKDSVTGLPLKGVEFKVTTSDGTVVPDAEGAISSNGYYVTDENGQIILENLAPDTYVVTETKTIDGYELDPAPQTVRVNANDLQTITFTNAPIGGLTIIKSDEDSGKRIAGVKFEVRKMNGEAVGTYTTDRNGLIQLPKLEKGWYTVTELKAADGYMLDDTPEQVEVKNGETATLELTNKKQSQILIHKVDANTGQGIYGVTFILYDRYQNPIGQYTSNQYGYVFIDEGLNEGKYYLREIMPADGYIADNQLKTVYVRYGSTTEITWENTAIKGQIQIIKKSADDNPVNGLPAGTLLEGAVFEIYDKAGNTVDIIKTDKNGRAVSKLLPLSRYTIREVQAPDYYSVNPTVINAYLEHEGQIVTFEVEDKSAITGVSIKKYGYNEVMPGQPIKYTFMEIANHSTVPLNSFYWRDTLPNQVVPTQLVTGTYNQNLYYKVVYMTNQSYGQYKTLADNLSTQRNYVLDMRPQTLGLAANEKITEVMFVFGTVKAGFAQVETPYLHGTVTNGLLNGSSFVNIADAGGLYNKQWIMHASRWLTTVYAQNISLPKTGY
ncbi:MAG: Cys-Gln thioester bond-forming surface protein, partial [Peptococcaceae bacterium]|nr:Cys-Gln thioester bond-forming surface protein [Peptococcaceae bacterium]